MTRERQNVLVLLWVVPLKTAPSLDKFINSHSASANPLSFNSSLLESVHWVCMWRYFALQVWSAGLGFRHHPVIQMTLCALHMQIIRRGLKTCTDVV